MEEIRSFKCPRPEKRVYNDRDSAVAFLKQSGNIKTQYAYECACSFWHCATNKTRDLRVERIDRALKIF